MPTLLGPFRKTCEITLGLLRQNEDSLMTILETFLHDPTTDFIGSVSYHFILELNITKKSFPVEKKDSGSSKSARNT